VNLIDHFYSIVKQIPKGRVSTYGRIASALGYRGAARAVGWMLHHNIHAPIVPCHRVVMSDGAIGGFGRGIAAKIKMLGEEGVRVENSYVVDFDALLFEDFHTVRPLEALRREQEMLASKVRIDDDFERGGILAAFDVAYLDDERRDYSIAFGAMVKWDLHAGTVMDIRTCRMDVRFPYIPTFLGYRELPLVRRLAGEKPDFDIMLLDGNGRLHPTGLGLASHAGVVLDRPSIGVAKGLLAGTSRPTARPELGEIFMDGVLVGHSLISSDRATRPIYISPGHRISPESSFDLVEGMCRYKIPEPLRRAHMAATEARNMNLRE